MTKYLVPFLSACISVLILLPGISYASQDFVQNKAERGMNAGPLELDYRDSAPAAGQENGSNLPTEKTSEEQKPVGQTKPGPGELFEKKGGYIHPSLSVAEYYTDNVFNTPDDRKSDFFTVISPGVWFSLPRRTDNATPIETSTLIPGGAALSNFISRYPGNVQAYFSYRADIERYSRYSSENNTTSQTAQGLVQYNFKGGLSVSVADVFLKSHDLRGTGVPLVELQKFNSNMVNTTVRYEVGDRWLLRADYFNFLVDYTTPNSDFRNRTDNLLSAYVYYKIQPKMSVFGQYEYVDMRFRTDTALNSKGSNFFGGIEWDVTAKSKGLIKMGYGLTDFRDPSIRPGNVFVLEAQIDHKFTPKTSLVLTAWRRRDASDVAQATSMVSTGVSAEYLQRLTSKITGSITLWYFVEKYDGDLTFGGQTGPLDDKYYQGDLALRYEFRKWLKAETGYTYSKKNSSFSAFEYTNNTVFVRLTGTL
jgi:hypothetical protein